MKCDRRSFIKTSLGLGVSSLATRVLPLAGATAKEFMSNTRTTRPFAVLGQLQLTDSTDGFPEAPRLATGSANSAWAVWLNRTPDGHDIICLRARIDKAKPGQWGAVQVVSDSGSDTPVVAADPNTPRAMIAWVRNIGDDWVLESRLCDEGTLSPVTRVSDAAVGRAAHPAIIPDRKGGFWAAWENYHDGRFSLHASHWQDGTWRQPIVLNTGSGNVYHPSLALDSADTLWVTFCRANEGRRDLLLTGLGSDGVTGRTPVPVCVADARTYQCGRSSVACDADDRIWIAWEYISDDKTTDAYFGMGECHVACFVGGRITTVSPRNAGQSAAVPLRDGNYQLPEIRFDPQGRLWLFSRSSQEERRAWTVTACHLDGTHGWTRPADLLVGQPLGRRGSLGVDIDAEGTLHIAWQSDNYIANGVAIGNTRGEVQAISVRLPAAEDPQPLVLAPLNPGRSTKKVHARTRAPRRTVEADGERFTLLFGNLHEHSNISRCWVDCADGDLHDKYRYGIDVEGYDFVGMTDHGFDLYEAAWRRSRQAARFYTQESAFIGIPAYEWTRMGRTLPPGSGHRNVIFASDDDAAKIILDSGNVPHKDSPESDQPEKLWNLLRGCGIHALTIPHHTADKEHPMNWDSHDPEYQRLVEVFQCRQSCEHRGAPRETKNATEHDECYVQDALARGYRLGFVASGDHNYMGTGLAAVLVRDVSLAGIFEALKSRRCYATTGDHMFVDFRVNGCIMGGETARKDQSVIELVVAGTEPLKDVAIFRNNEIMLHKKEEDLTEGNADLRLSYTDNATDGAAYYYARVIQQNNEIAWASPVWLNASA